MNKFERLKTMNSQEAQELIASIVGEDSARKFFVEEPTKVAANSVNVGSFIKYGNLEWVVLDKTPDGIKVLSKHILFNRAFDSNEKNNWAEASLRKDLNNFNKGGCCVANDNTTGIKKKDLVKFGRNLLTDDGMPDYGRCEDHISLITCEEYRKYRKHIPNADDWWWTATGDSLVYSYFVRVSTRAVLWPPQCSFWALWRASALYSEI